MEKKGTYSKNTMFCLLNCWKYVFFVALIFILCSSSQGFEIRPATDNDIIKARKILFREAMNPFSLRKEYMLVAVDYNDGDNGYNQEENLIGFGQIRPIDDDFAELASLFVVPDRRRQGLGAALVQTLLEKHKDKDASSSPSKVCLLTLKPTASFYEPFGFKVASDDELQQLPSSLKNEYLAGSAISLVLGNSIICMVESRHEDART